MSIEINSSLCDPLTKMLIRYFIFNKKKIISILNGNTPRTQGNTQRHNAPVLNKKG